MVRRGSPTTLVALAVFAGLALSQEPARGPLVPEQPAAVSEGAKLVFTPTPDPRAAVLGAPRVSSMDVPDDRAAFAVPRKTAAAHSPWEIRHVNGVAIAAPHVPHAHRPPGFAISLEGLWEIAERYQSELREASALYDEALGRSVQARKYPNPIFNYHHEMIGASAAPAGDYAFDYKQEFLTAGKWRLGKTQAATQAEAVGLMIQEKRFEVLTRLRKGYMDYLALLQENRVLTDSIAALSKRHEQALLLLKEAKLLSKTEVISLELLLEELKSEQVRAAAELMAAWGQLAADVGVPDLPQPEDILDRKRSVPVWTLEEVEERLRQTTPLRRALLEAEAARWGMLRARADAVPNITVGGGYFRQNTAGIQGATINVETPIPLWDRKQGKIREAEAALARANAAVRSLELRLVGQAREAWGRFVSARDNLRRINVEILPRLKSRADLIKQAYEARAENVNFNDVFQAEQGYYKGQVDMFRFRRAMWRAVAELEGLMQAPPQGEVSER